MGKTAGREVTGPEHSLVLQLAMPWSRESSRAPGGTRTS